MESMIDTMIGQFGPWAVVVGALIWEAKFVQQQLEASRQDRNRTEDRHEQEVKELTNVIANNTVALTQLTDYIKGGESL